MTSNTATSDVPYPSPLLLKTLNTLIIPLVSSSGEHPTLLSIVMWMAGRYDDAVCTVLQAEVSAH